MGEGGVEEKGTSPEIFEVVCVCVGGGEIHIHTIPHTQFKFPKPKEIVSKDKLYFPPPHKHYWSDKNPKLEI